MADVMSPIVRICLLTLSIVPFCLHANQDMPSNKSTSVVTKTFVLPPGWKTKDPVRFTKRGSTIEYEFSGVVRDSVGPEKLFSTYATSEKNKNPFISNYVNECIEDDVVIHPEIFIFSNYGFKAGGFECQSEINSSLIIYLLKNNNKLDEYLVFTWNKKSNKRFSKKEVMTRLGYSLQAAVQFLICREDCVLENLNNETQMTFNFFEKIKSYEKSMHSETKKKDDDYYAFVLSTFGIFPGSIYGKNEVCRSASVSSFVKVCSFHDEKKQIIDVDGTERLTDSDFPGLIGINIKSYDAPYEGSHCEKGKKHPLDYKIKIGIKNFHDHKWFFCKDSSKIYSVISIITMNINSPHKIVFETIWDVPNDTDENFYLYMDYVNREIFRKTASVYVCKKDSYLHDC